MNSEPTITVLMVVYNAEAFLREAVDSILAQTFSDFELLVVVDGSTDSSVEILESYDDDRIVRLRNETNLGQPRARNRGLEVARGRYVAVMDGDDVAEPERLARQLSYLEGLPRVTVLGTWVTSIDENGREIGPDHTPTDPASLAWEFCWDCPLYHPTVMMRPGPIRALGGYDQRYWTAQDYDLWTRALMAGLRIDNLAEPLLRLPGQLIADLPSAAQRAGGIRFGDRGPLHRLAPRRTCAAGAHRWDARVPLRLKLHRSRDRRKCQPDDRSGPQGARSLP